MMKRFVHELRYSRKITHRNVIRIYDFLHLQGAYAISMEYFPSHTLSGEIPDNKPMPLDKVMRYSRDMATGKEQSIEVSPAGGLSKAEIDALIAEADMHRQDDQDRRGHVAGGQRDVREMHEFVEQRRLMLGPLREREARRDQLRDREKRDGYRRRPL